MAEFETIILRFRDLVTELGDTIRQHEALSKKQGHVWWGWWHKGGERVPPDAFGALKEKATAGALKIFLMDTGQLRLYRAACLDIAWGEHSEEIPSPDLAASPAYYNKRSYLAWFKLKDFEEIDDINTTLRTLSYARVDDFFEERASRFDVFYDKRIYSMAELRYQDRTIWFARAYRPEDRTDEVDLLDTGEAATRQTAHMTPKVRSAKPLARTPQAMPIVMISSTVRDLPEYRDAARDACIRMDMFPKMMEYRPAVDANAIEESLNMVDAADIYVGIFAHRYGYVPEGYDTSITEMEYERAVEKDKPRLLFIMHDEVPVLPKDVDKGDAAVRLEQLKDRLKKERVVDFFKNPEDLRGLIGDSLREYKLTGAALVAVDQAEVAAQKPPEDTPPPHFTEDYVATESTRMLWVSDLHFALQKGVHHFPLESEAHQFALNRRLEMELADEVDTLAGVIMSGDFAWKAEPAEFEKAAKFIERLDSWIPLEPDQLAMCPGNHDVSFKSPADGQEAARRVAPEQARAAYSAFYQGVFERAPNEFMSCGRRLLVGRALPVDIVCLNSALFERTSDSFRGPGFVGREQRKHAADEMGWTALAPEAPRAYRIVVVHHHVLPQSIRADASASYVHMIRDSGSLIRWLVKHRVDLVLHGHGHQPACAKLSRPIDRSPPDAPWHDLYVMGMGSTGSHPDHLGEFGKNTFGLLDFKKDTLTVSMRTIHPTIPSEEVWSMDLPLTR